MSTIDKLEYDALTSGTAVMQRVDAGVLVLSDADRADFLQRMTTNNISALQSGESTVTVLTNPMARILYVFGVVCRADNLLLLPDVGQAEALVRHLRSQIFFMGRDSTPIFVRFNGQKETIFGPGAWPSPVNGCLWL